MFQSLRFQKLSNLNLHKALSILLNETLEKLLKVY